MTNCSLRGEIPPSLEPKIFTVPKTVKYLNERVPGCGVTVTTLRKLVKAGKIPSQRIGNRYFVDVNEVLAYYAGV